MKLRWIAPLALVAAFAGGTALAPSGLPASNGAVVRPDMRSELALFREVCIAPASHREILGRARASGWETLEGEAIPSLLRGNGSLRLVEVLRGEIAGRPALIRVADLGGTSFCTVYFQPEAPAAMVERLKDEVVLGSPLGDPDFDGDLNYPEGWKAIGWHRVVADDWRAVHYSFDPDDKGPNADWQAFGITRKI